MPVPTPDLASPAVRRRARSVRRRLRAHRRTFAALLLGVAVLAGLRAVDPPPPRTAPVVVAARDLAPGERLRPDNLTTVPVPLDLVPDGLADAPTGRVLAAGIRRGEPLTDVRLVTPGLGHLASGTTALPVRLPDAGTASLLAPGDEVDLLATDPGDGTTRTVATGVRVLAVPTDVPDGPSGGSSGALLVLQVADHEVGPVTGASLSEFLSVALEG